MLGGLDGPSSDYKTNLSQARMNRSDQLGETCLRNTFAGPPITVPTQLKTFLVKEVALNKEHYLPLIRDGFVSQQSVLR